MCMKKSIIYVKIKRDKKKGIIFGVFSYLGQNPNFNQKGINYLIYIIFTIYVQKIK